MGFQKGNTLRKDGVSGRRKGSKDKKTLIKEQLGKSLWEQTAEAVDRNMNEFINSEDDNVRLIATKYFAKFFRAEKSHTTIEGHIELSDKEISEKVALRLGIDKY